jgi:hypothetical protein
MPWVSFTNLDARRKSMKMGWRMTMSLKAQIRRLCVLFFSLVLLIFYRAKLENLRGMDILTLVSASNVE